MQFARFVFAKRLRTSLPCGVQLARLCFLQPVRCVWIDESTRYRSDRFVYAPNASSRFAKALALAHRHPAGQTCTLTLCATYSDANLRKHCNINGLGKAKNFFEKNAKKLLTWRKETFILVCARGKCESASQTQHLENFIVQR